MAISAQLLQQAKNCAASIDELIEMLRIMKRSGCLNIFSYHNTKNDVDEDSWKKACQLLDDAKKYFKIFLDGLRQDEEWRNCFVNPEFTERTLNILSTRLDAIILTNNLLTVTTQLENISNNLNANMTTFIEFECIE